MVAARQSTKHPLGAIWAAVGITLILGGAIFRVTPRVFDAFDVGLSLWQWVILVAWVGFMLVSEGYRGFQLKFSPRVATRMWYLYQHGRTLDLWLAPLYCIGYYGAPRRRIISSWLLTIGVALIIIVVSQFTQPWRGIIDCGVVLGLLYGLISVYVSIWQKFHGYFN